MTNASQPILEKALTKLRAQEAEVLKTKQFINQICEFDGMEPMFPDLESGVIVATGMGAKQLAPDAFTGKPLATAVRMVLDERKKRHAHGPASLEEIHQKLVEGGFDFPSREAANQKNGLGVSLAKNTTVFRKLPNGLWGLVEWYGAPSPRQRKRTSEPIGPSTPGIADDELGVEDLELNEETQEGQENP